MQKTEAGNIELKNILIGVTTVAMIVLGSVFISDSVQAETKEQSEISSERSTIKANISKAEAEITDVLIDLQEINKEITETDKTLKANEEAKAEIEEEITSTEKDIAKFKIEIDVLETKMKERYEVLKQRASSYQSNGGDIGYLEVLLGAKSFSEFISRVSVVTKITNSDADLMKLHEMDKEEVEKQHKAVEDKLTELKEVKNELEAIEILVKEQKSAIESKKNELKNKEKELNKVKSELRIKDERLASLEAKVKESLTTSAQNPNDIKTFGKSDKLNQVSSNSGSGQLVWPTSGGYISSQMGSRGGRMHKGIDIARTDRSTSPPIFAADGGVVESAGPSGGYGNKIVVNHGNGMKTIYAHLSSISVSSGQSVSKGDPLGIMGSTGNSTGIHLHFEVYVNGGLQNPTKYLN